MHHRNPLTLPDTPYPLCRGWMRRAVNHKGGISGAFNFGWVISRFKLGAKFPSQNPGSSAKLAPVTQLHRAYKASHTTIFLGVSVKFTAQTPWASVKFPAAKFTTTTLTWYEIRPPPPVCRRDLGVEGGGGGHRESVSGLRAAHCSNGQLICPTPTKHLSNFATALPCIRSGVFLFFGFCFYG